VRATETKQLNKTRLFRCDIFLSTGPSIIAYHHFLSVSRSKFAKKPVATILNRLAIQLSWLQLIVSPCSKQARKPANLMLSFGGFRNSVSGLGPCQIVAMQWIAPRFFKVSAFSAKIVKKLI
jgi:hypothetical protein